MVKTIRGLIGIWWTSRGRITNIGQRNGLRRTMTFVTSYSLLEVIILIIVLMKMTTSDVTMRSWGWSEAVVLGQVREVGVQPGRVQVLKPILKGYASVPGWGCVWKKEKRLELKIEFHHYDKWAEEERRPWRLSLQCVKLFILPQPKLCVKSIFGWKKNVALSFSSSEIWCYLFLDKGQFLCGRKLLFLHTVC